MVPNLLLRGATWVIMLPSAPDPFHDQAAGSALLAGLTGRSKKRKGPKSKAAAKAKSAAEPSEGKGK